MSYRSREIKYIRIFKGIFCKKSRVLSSRVKLVRTVRLHL
jgi:hypothetical protein